MCLVYPKCRSTYLRQLFQTLIRTNRMHVLKNGYRTDSALTYAIQLQITPRNLEETITAARYFKGIAKPTNVFGVAAVIKHIKQLFTSEKTIKITKNN